MAPLNYFTGLNFAGLRFQKAGGVAVGRASHYMLDARILSKRDNEALWRRVGLNNGRSKAGVCCQHIRRKHRRINNPTGTALGKTVLRY